MGSVTFSANLGHMHNLHDQAGPPREVLGTLARASFRVVLLPSKTRLDKRPLDRVNEILSKRSVHASRSSLLRARLGRNFLKFPLSV